MNQLPNDYRVASVRLTDRAVPLIEFLALKYEGMVVGSNGDEGTLVADVVVPAGATGDFVKDSKGISGVKSVKVRLADDSLRKMLESYTTFFVEFDDDETVPLITRLASAHNASRFSYETRQVGHWNTMYSAKISVPNPYAKRFADSCRRIEGVAVSTHTLDEMVIAVMRTTHRWALPGLESK